jgi:hypothetical protein
LYGAIEERIAMRSLIVAALAAGFLLYGNAPMHADECDNAISDYKKLLDEGDEKFEADMTKEFGKQSASTDIEDEKNCPRMLHIYREQLSRAEALVPAERKQNEVCTEERIRTAYGDEGPYRTESLIGGSRIVIKKCRDYVAALPKKPFKPAKGCAPALTEINVLLKKMLSETNQIATDMERFGGQAGEQQLCIYGRTFAQPAHERQVREYSEKAAENPKCHDPAVLEMLHASNEETAEIVDRACAVVEEKK